MTRGEDASASPVNQAVAATIQAWRRHKGWDQQQMYEAAGIKRSTYVRIEAGITWITAEHVFKIAQACELPAQLLIDDAIRHHPEAFPSATRGDAESLVDRAIEAARAQLQHPSDPPQEPVDQVG